MGELQPHRPRRPLPDLQGLGSMSPLGSKEGISPISLKIHSTCPTSLTPSPVKPPQSPRLTGCFSLTGHRCAPRRPDATARAEERASRAPSQRTCVPALELGKWSGLEVVGETATSGRGKRPAPRLPRYPRMAGPTPPQDPGLSSWRGGRHPAAGADTWRRPRSQPPVGASAAGRFPAKGYRGREQSAPIGEGGLAAAGRGGRSHFLGTLGPLFVVHDPLQRGPAPARGGRCVLPRGLPQPRAPHLSPFRPSPAGRAKGPAFPARGFSTKPSRGRGRSGSTRVEGASRSGRTRPGKRRSGADATRAAHKLGSPRLRLSQANFPEPPAASSARLTSGSQRKARGPAAPARPAPAPAPLRPNLPRREGARRPGFATLGVPARGPGLN